MKPLIIGEAPGKNGDPSKPIEGRVGARLAACCGISFEEFLQTFDRVNLLAFQPQDAPNGKGMSFNVRAAGSVARELEKVFAPGQVVILLGKRVAAAFRLIDVEYFKQVTLRNGYTVYIVPHPSGVNRWWNDVNNELQVIQFMHRLVRELKK